ncbi:MAG: FAD-binding protein [Deltaproteobacteria bacterium]|nr:FAD-binding protein [Deltaproteobacteria bacterium]MBW2015284.1 FAD-binding protein [Deltaproteobacteria bacterium]MBW2127816.1 FAD-binding protein [Deltaproteobacteria bacterium]MBW2302100.1 FAD-binding protein [Deltaproteobacteria bacterium]
MDIYDEIRQIVGSENVFTGPVECIPYSRDLSVHEGIPDAVVFAYTTEQISAILKLANKEKVPVTVQGSGTATTGASLPVYGGILLDVHKMNKILEVDTQNFFARVEPGVICMDLNRRLAQDNLMFPPNPGSEMIATIGGMMSTNASGHKAVKYGTARDYVKALKVVLADGTVINTGFKTPKASFGYDLNHVFCSAEGTLGVITEITVKIQPKPEYNALALAVFEDLFSAGSAVSEIIGSGIQLAACEIMDKYSLKVVENVIERDISGIEAMLIIEADGAKEVVVRDMNKMEEICKKHKVKDFTWSDDPAKAGEIMEARGKLVPTLSRIKPGNRLVAISEDLGIPPSRIPEVIKKAQEISDKYDLLITTFGHIGDGNVHTTFVTDMRSKEQWDRLKPAADELADIAIEMGGVVTAEHGTGLARAPYIEKQLGPALEVMRSIKQALDPNNILNPGKFGLERKKYDIYDYFAFKTFLEHPEGLNSLGENIDNEILACIACGFCRLGCPTFSVTQRESRNARGRNVLAFNFLNGTIEPSKELAEALYSCTTCQACTYFCPAQVKVDEIVEAMRKRLYKAGFTPAETLAVRENILVNGNVYASPQEERIEIYPKELKEKAERGELKPQAETLLFMGCVPSYLDMKMVPSFIKILDAAGVDYTTLAKDEVCCGFPLFLMGSDEFEEHAKKMIEKIRATGAGELITPCAGCYKTFKKLYPEYGDLGLEVYHSVTYFEKLVAEGKIKFKGDLGKKVTYHDPCDLGRSFKIFEEPRNILKAIPGLEYVEMARNRLQARCCGGGGGVSAISPELSVQMAEERVRDALAVGAEIIVSGCAACKDNLRKGAKAIPKQERGKIKVMDITEILASNME